MSWFSGAFHKGRTECAALIDASMSVVTGAYAHRTDDRAPTICYVTHEPVAPHEGEELQRAMLRALALVTSRMISQGAPVLNKAIGHSHADDVIIAAGSPWQELLLRTRHFEDAKPFVFTREMVRDTVEASKKADQGKRAVSELVVATLLNGYATKEPYGKRVTRASAIVLASYVDDAVAKALEKAGRAAFHTDAVSLISGSALKYISTQEGFPHEQNAIILDVTTQAVSLALIRKGLLVALAQAKGGEQGTAAWLDSVKAGLADLSRQFPLPPTIFLLAPADVSSKAKETLDAADLSDLWLSDNQPRIVAVLPSHIANMSATTEVDLISVLLARFWASRFFVA